MSSPSKIPTLATDIERLKEMGIEPFKLKELGPSTLQAAKLLIGETIMAALTNLHDPLLSMVIAVLESGQSMLDGGIAPEQVVEYVTGRFEGFYNAAQQAQEQQTA